MITLNHLDPNPQGRPLVLLLHGLGADGSSWILQFPDLVRAGFRPIAPDLPGFGESPYDGKGWSIRRVAAQLAVLVNELGAAPAHVVGLSLGGTVAQQLALDFPELVDKLVLASTFAALRPAHWRGWLYLLNRLVLVHTVGIPTQARFVARRVFPGAEGDVLRSMLIEKVTRADPRAYRSAMRALGWFDSRARLGRLRVPVLVVTGQNDTTVSPANQHALVERIPAAQQVVIPAAGHAVSVDQPELFNKIILDFLKA